MDLVTPTDMNWEPFLAPTENDYAWRVEDAEEEIFLLYSQLQSSSGSQLNDDDENDTSKESGLGSVNSREGKLTITLPVCHCQTCDRKRITNSLQHRRKGLNNSVNPPPPTEISLFQDLTALNSRKGDTGSVLWRASKKLAFLALSETLFSHSSCATCQVLELGAGTGLLAIALAPFVKRYIATDLPSLIPLISKNIMHNPSQRNISTVALDWVEFQSISLDTRLKAYNDVWIEEFSEGSPRVILVVDCIYNPSLVDPLLTVINHFSNSKDNGKVIVLIVMELRSEDVTRLFLSRWMDIGQWEIWSLRTLGSQFAVWLGRQRN